MTTIKPCKCKSPYQDKKYGKDKRVFNEGNLVWRCTVCGAEQKKETK